MTTAERHTAIPDGRDSSHYLALRNAGRTRLAWECLIRNEWFQADCLAVELGFAEARTVADDWFLFCFKPWYEPFATNKPARFVDWVRKFSGRRSKPVRRVSMSGSEVAYVFNIAVMSESHDLRKAQLALFSARLDRQIERFRIKTGRTSNLPQPGRARPDANVEACLQIHDLLRSSTPSAEIKHLVPYLKVLLPRNHAEDGNDRLAVNRRFIDLKNRAQKLIEDRGYVQLFLPKSGGDK